MFDKQITAVLIVGAITARWPEAVPEGLCRLLLQLNETGEETAPSGYTGNSFLLPILTIANTHRRSVPDIC